MRKIGFFNSAKTWGGGEKWHYEAALYFACRGYSVFFFSQEGSVLQQKITEQPAISFVPFNVGNYSFLNRQKVQALKHTFQSLGIDTLLINLSSDLKLAGQAASKAGVKRIIYRRGSAIPIKNSFFNKYVFKHWVTDILANSEATKKTILQYNARLFPEHKIKVIYNPIDVESFVNTPFEPIYYKASGELVIANLGRLEEQKNQRFLMLLSVELDRRGIAHKIIVAGSGRLDRELKKLSNSLNVADNILFTGFIHNVKDVLMSCDIFLLPSLWEGFGYVLAEASLCRKAIVAFDISSNPELVLPDVSGFLVTKNDVKECAEKVCLLRNNPQLREKMGADGMLHIINTFEKNRIMATIEAYINE
ncbi:Glycosyltransferase involved in cell wall bisynthesis [Parapedobacter luteus]|uniref:Glycosyltransferase involved in cell wall bisynthesis n=1 Tax=Parapedobacter luteus TaxID=623280 RepID=A0A1T4ZUN5_9SPHI|nr:glycosyltransferase [Parapedobacter luteus]SKB26219.1 Glycosyltransferase involved in cell wall bisynthesis [Parapedobacter luteus]